jgi:N-acetylneuraminic acid mutarotase
VPIYDSVVTSLGGNLYSFGGRTTGNVVLANSYKFDGTTWTAIAPVPVALTSAAAVNDGTNIYILGGSATGAPLLNTVYRYNLSSNTYTTLAPFAIATAGHAAAYLGGKIYKFCGSVAGLSFTTDALEIYDIALDQWTAGANYPLPGGATSVRGFALGNFIYGAGGTLIFPIPGDTGLTCRYDPATNTWSNNAIADLPAPRSRAAVAAYNGGAVIPLPTPGLPCRTCWEHVKT